MFENIFLTRNWRGATFETGLCRPSLRRFLDEEETISYTNILYKTFLKTKNFHFSVVR